MKYTANVKGTHTSWQNSMSESAANIARTLHCAVIPCTTYTCGFLYVIAIACPNTLSCNIHVNALGIAAW